MKKRQTVIGLLLCLSFACFDVSAMSAGKSEYATLVDVCKQIKLGSTEDQVRSMMGPPAKTKAIQKDGRKLRVLMYAAPSIVSTPPDVVIDAESQRVVELICDDRYHLK